MTPTSFVSVSKWTRTHTNRLLFDAGLGIYDQEYTELYQPEVSRLQTRRSGTPTDPRGARLHAPRQLHAGSAPARGTIRPTTSRCCAPIRVRSYVTGTHSFRFGGAVSEGNWRLVRQWTGDISPITYTNGARGRDAPASDRSPQRHQGRRRPVRAGSWTIGRATMNAGPRYDRFIGESQESDVLPSRFNAGSIRQVPGRQERSDGRLRRHGAELEGLSPRVGVRSTCSATAGRR